MPDGYRHLDIGEKIQVGDEYNNGTDWMLVPDFLVGSKVQEKSSQWRRTISITDSNATKKKWFLFLFGK
jgi:hypothetical protein